MALIVVPAAATAPAYPLKKSANGRYLVDQDNAPCLIVGDSPQALIVKISETDAERFIADRSAHGFNTLWINLLCETYTGGYADGSTIDGVFPFTNTVPGATSYDLTTPNEVYFAHVDRILNLAAQYGLLVLLDPIETGGWFTTITNNGAGSCRNYGRYLGNRYRNFDNIIWMSGNDYWNWGDADTDAVVREVALGIQETDPRHLHTIELLAPAGSLDDRSWESVIGLNATYTYYPTYAQLLKDYNRTNFLPNFMVEANYEFEYDWTGNATLRRQEYWAMLSGATGQLYGNKYTWQFILGWQTHLGTPGTIQMGYVKALFGSRAWYDLIPDQDHSVVTAGYGTFTNAGNVNDSDYATAARTADGALVIAYQPTIRIITVDMSKLDASAVARWYDPANGSYIQIPGSPFPNNGARNFIPPGNNSDGDGDWALVLETQPPETQPPTVTLTAPTAGATVSNTVALSATATDNVGVVGVQFQVDGANLGAEALSGPYANLWNTLNAINGLHTVQAIARDLAGNRATNSVSVTVENALPPALAAVAGYAFNEGNGTTVSDVSGNGNTGTISGAAWTTSGKYGNALSFSDSSWVTVSDSDSLDLSNNGLTLEAWVYPTNFPLNWGTIFLKEASGDLAYALLLYTESGAIRPELYVRTPGGLQTVPGAFGLPFNTWSHIAGTYDGVNLQLYVNGHEVATTPASGKIITSTGALRMGGNSIWGEYFVGAIDEVRVYNRALSQAEIQSDMNTAIGAVNHLPVAGSDTIERPPTDGTKVPISTLLSNDSDADGDPLAFVGVSATSAHGGSVTRSGDWIFYTPPAGYTNGDSFTYTISDGRGAPVLGTVNVSVQEDLVPSPNLAISDLGNGTYRIRFDGIPGRTYRIEYTEDADHASWQSLGTGTANEFGLFQFTDSSSNGAPQRFYHSVYP